MFLPTQTSFNPGRALPITLRTLAFWAESLQLACCFLGFYSPVLGAEVSGRVLSFPSRLQPQLCVDHVPWCQSLCWAGGMWGCMMPQACLPGQDHVADGQQGPWRSGCSQASLCGTGSGQCRRTCQELWGCSGVGACVGRMALPRVGEPWPGVGWALLPVDLAVGSPARFQELEQPLSLSASSAPGEALALCEQRAH